MTLRLVAPKAPFVQCGHVRVCDPVSVERERLPFSSPHNCTNVYPLGQSSRTDQENIEQGRSLALITGHQQTFKLNQKREQSAHHQQLGVIGALGAFVISISVAAVDSAEEVKTSCRRRVRVGGDRPSAQGLCGAELGPAQAEVG